MMFYPTYDKPNVNSIVMPEKQISPPHPGIPLGLGSAFAALPPPPPYPLDQRSHDRFLWDSASRLHHLHPPAHHSLTSLGTSPNPLELPHLLGSGRLGHSTLGAVPELTVPHPTYRIPPYMEHLYQSLHTSPQTSLRGLSPLERSGLTLGSEYFGMSGLAASRLSDPHLLPASLTSTDLAFSLDGSRLASPRPSLRQSRKRALSSSPYSDSFDINSMIRFSPNSLVSIMNGSRSSSTSGSYGHLSAGAISPALGMPPSIGSASTQLQQLQAHLLRGPISGSHFLSPSPLLSHPPSSFAHPNSIFSLGSHVQSPQFPLKSDFESTKELTSLLTPREDDKNKTQKKDVPSSIAAATAVKSVAGNRNGVVVPPTPGVNGTSDGTSTTILGMDDDNPKEEPDDFIETNCNWKECSKEFNTQDELVKHINSDHIHANKKSFVCRWKECSREEKPFKAQYMLVVHMRRHTGEKPHRCTFEGCFKAYSRLENLKTHLRSHTGEKPYMCEYPGCTKAFSNASDRAKHQNRTHSNEKPYICKAPGCTKRYTDPSSLRKHVKTVHGADFYASKKHKGNNHPSNNSGTGAAGNNKERNNGTNSEGSPNSEGGKGGSLSSPSVKSEDPTSPGQGHSPPMGVGGTTPMDQSRLIGGPISDNNVSTTGGGFDSFLRTECENDDDLDASADLGSMGGNHHLSSGDGLLVSGVVGVHGDRSVRGKCKSRFQAKGLANVLHNVPLGPRRSSGGMGELSQGITDLKMGANITQPPISQSSRKNMLEPPYRRDSSSTVSTFYGSMKSDSSHLMSRRDSEQSHFSGASLGCGGRRSVATSFYDPISCGSSRRSSENSNYHVPTIPHHINSHSQFAKFQRNGMVMNCDSFNTSNLVVQTQNMSLSQESLNNQQWNSGVPGNYSANGGVPGSMDSTNGGYFGGMGPIGPPTGQSKESTRRASDPIKPLERGLSDPNRRLPRHNSYTNFNPRTPMGLRTPPTYNNHPNHGLHLDQVGEDEPIENKLILPDDMVNYLNQNGNNSDNKLEGRDGFSRPPGTPNSLYSQPVPSPAFSNQNVPSPAYPNMMSPYPNQAVPPINNYQYNQQSAVYPVPPSPGHTLGYQSQQFNNVVPNGSTTPNGSCNPVHNMYPYQQQNSANFYSGQNQQHGGSSQGSPFIQQHQYSHYSQQMMNLQSQHQMYGAAAQHQQRYNSNIYGTQTPVTPYGLGSDSHGPAQHVCGHLALPNLPHAAYQSPCSTCQNAGSANTPQPHFHPSGWQMNTSNYNFSYGPHFYGQGQIGMGYPENIGHYANGDPMGMYQTSLASDVQCRDVSQSTQSLLTSKSKANKVKENNEKTPASVSTAQTDPSATPTTETVSPVKEIIKTPKPEDQKPPSDAKPLQAKSEAKPGTNDTSYMKSDTYQRTLEYVQQCQTWNPSTVKEEVTSTTDQKPELDSKGTVVGYNAPTTVASLPPPVAPTSAPLNSIQARFSTPLPPPIPETPNMVINDLTSSLTSLQEENKFLQMLQ